MKLVIKIKTNKIELDLINRRKMTGRREWQEINPLSRLLLSNLDSLLQKNGVGVDRISGYKIISEVPKKWTTCRIAEITLRSLMLARLAR